VNFQGWLKNNLFESVFQNNNNTSIVHSHLRDAHLIIPDNFDLISYVYSPDNICLRGNKAEILMTWELLSIISVDWITRQNNIPLLINQIPINPQFDQQLSNELGDLKLIDIQLSFTANFPYSRFRYIYDKRNMRNLYDFSLDLMNSFLDFFDVKEQTSNKSS
jgi:hypothetical protein